MSTPSVPSGSGQRARSVERRKSMETISMIFVEELTTNEGVTRALEGFQCSRSVRDLKKKIAQESGLGAKWAGIEAFYGSTNLADLNKPLSDYGITNGDTIYFVRNSIPEPPPPPYPGNGESADAGKVPVLKTIFFKDLDGRSLTLTDVSLDMTVQAMAERLGNEKAMDTSWLRFTWAGKQWNPEKKLLEYNLSENATIHITARLHGGYRA